jgi:hypothetical protein
MQTQVPRAFTKKTRLASSNFLFGFFVNFASLWR